MDTEHQPPPVLDQAAQAEYERQIMINHLRVGCYLVIVLMPFGVVLDYVYFHRFHTLFFVLRLACSLLLAGILPVLRMPFGERHHVAMGQLVALLPAFCICCMIYVEDGPSSPYYAGLNLILLAVAFVLRWSASVSLLTLVLTVFMYLGACLLHGFPKEGAPSTSTDSPRKEAFKDFGNNLYFLALTGVIVVTGSRIHHKLRVRENALSQQLARSKQALELSNRQLEGTIEKLRTTQLLLVQSEKRRSMGVLASGIIHDIGNTLNHARTNVFALRKKMSVIPPQHMAAFDHISGDIESGIKQAMSTVQKVRIYTHPDTEIQDRIDLKDLVDSALLFTNSRWRENQVRIETQIQEGQCVWGNKQNLIDVMVNLILNSVDALSHKSADGGEPRTIRIDSSMQKGRSLVRIRDNGIGIDPAIIDKIFDPYFTTKDVGEGTGLGLSTCKSTVEQYGGTITVRSEPGQFCEFNLDFPVMASDPTN